MEIKISEEEKKLIDSINNYGYTYETTIQLADINLNQGRRGKAYYYYSKALDLCEDDKIKVLIQRNITGLGMESEVANYIKRKKVLMIAYIFPPLGGSGVQRTLKYAKYLRDFNYEPIIVAVGKVSTPYLKDESLSEEVPKDMEIIRVDEPSGCGNYDIDYLLKLYRDMVSDTNLTNQYVNILVKNNNGSNYNYYSMPDVNSAWGIRVLQNINKLVDFDSIDVIYSTSGPYTDHMVAYELKNIYKKPWVADFRDEWTNNPYFNYDDNNLFSRMTRCMETSIVKKCDRLITVTSISRENYIDIFSVGENKVRCITNGYDEEDFKDINSSIEKNSKFNIIHNGLFYLEITPETLLKAVNELISSGIISKEKMQIIFSYTENKDKWEKYIKDNDMSEIVQFKEYMGHRESIQLAINCDVLLLVLGHGEKKKSVYTGKVFEYLRMKKPILALVPKESLVDKLIFETNSGKAVEFYDIEGIKDYILELYKKWENSKENLPINNTGIEKYERRSLTNNLAEIFNDIL